VTADLLTLFPGMLSGMLDSSILGRAQKEGLFRLRLHDLRDFAHDKHRTVDDRPFGGGPGMVLKCGPLVEAIEHIQALDPEPSHIIYLSPEGKPFAQSDAVRACR
jgi:tRNA (guanine37-N1)-methyltransferase